MHVTYVDKVIMSKVKVTVTTSLFSWLQQQL